MYIRFSDACTGTQFTSGSRRLRSTSTRRTKTPVRNVLEGQESGRGYLEELGPGPGQSIFHLGMFLLGCKAPT